LTDTAGAHPETQCDVLVVGGGPGGSTIAALLAERGRNVVLVEKEKHPRFHIGESLLPLNLPLLDRLGVKDQVAQIGMLKYGAEFISPYHDKTVTFEFADAWDKRYPYAYQVRRSEFDHVLLKNAAAKGATVIEECKITEVDFLPDGSTLARGHDKDGQNHVWRAKFLVDASGRDTFLANRFGIKKRNSKHNSAAIFGHFSNAQRLPGKAEGNISIFWFEHGWFWFIPLHDGTTSVGAVCWPYYMKTRKTDPTTFFMKTIALCPAVAERLKDASLTASVTATGNYSYRAQRMTGNGYIMVGDAFAFIDPVFSTGVYLAMNSAFLGADTVATCLDEPRQAARALKRFDAQIRRGIDTFSWYIYRVTTPTLREMFMGPSNVLRVQEAVLSLLAGDIFRHSAIRSRLMVFKAIYYAQSLLNFKRSFIGWRRLKRAIQVPAGEAT
jgi:flavin-dependent dehydrogenase